MAKKIWMIKRTYNCLTCNIKEIQTNAALMKHLATHGIQKGTAYERSLQLALDGTGWHALQFLFDFKEQKVQVTMYQQEALEKVDDIHDAEQNGWHVKKST